MQKVILAILCVILNLTYAVSYNDYCLDLESVSRTRVIGLKSWKKVENFLADPDFLQRSVNLSLEDKFPDISQFIPHMDCRQLLKTACHLKRLRILTQTLKTAYENVFYFLEFSIETLNPENTSRLWSCISGCSYRLPEHFLERLDRHTVKQSKNFSNSLVIATLRHLLMLPEKGAFGCFITMFSGLEELHNPTDFHFYLFLKTYLVETRRLSIVAKKSMAVAIKSYKEEARYSLTTSSLQLEVKDFLKVFEPRFECEVFYEDLDTHLDIADVASKVVVDMDGPQHNKINRSTKELFRRPLDLMRDTVLLNGGWKVYRITPEEWGAFKGSYATKMTERSTLDAFYSLYRVLT